MINREWMKRRFYDMRIGHSTYLIFFIAFAQFMIISHELYIEQNEILNQIFPNLFVWAIFFLLTYVPASIYIGHKHLRTQYNTEAKQLTDKSPYTYQAVPGKEQDYGLPAAIMGYEMQLKGMEMNNKSADLLSNIFKQDFPKWNNEAFERVQHYLDMTKRLQKGESITDIIGSSSKKN